MKNTLVFSSEGSGMFSLSEINLCPHGQVSIYIEKNLYLKRLVQIVLDASLFLQVKLSAFIP